MAKALPLKRIDLGHYQVWQGARAVTQFGVKRTSLHFGWYASPELEHEAAIAVAETLMEARPELTLWAVGSDLYGPKISRLQEKLYEVRLRKRIDRLQARLRLNRILEGHAIYALQLAGAPPPDSDFSDTLFLQPGEELDLLEGALEDDGPITVGLARRGALALDFTHDRDLLVCNLVTAPGNDLEPIFRHWVDPSAPGLIG